MSSSSSSSSSITTTNMTNDKHKQDVTKKRKFLKVSQTMLPKGHSLKIVNKDKNPGSLITANNFPQFDSNPLLSRIHNFLPKLKGANDELEIRMNKGEDPQKFNVEYISDEEKEHVEMNIQLVLDDDGDDDRSDKNNMGHDSNISINASTLKLPNHDVKKQKISNTALIEEIKINKYNTIDNKQQQGVHSKPLISIIIPVYNGEKDLNSCFNSILKQTFDPTKYEVSIYNDASIDKTADIILNWQEKFQENGTSFVHNIISPTQFITTGNGDSSNSSNNNNVCLTKNKGAGYAKNMAVKQSHGIYLCFLDSDDTMMPNRLEKQYQFYLNYMENNNDNNVLATTNDNLLLGSGFIRDPIDATERYTRWCNTLSDKELYLHQYRELTIIQPTWFLKRGWFDHVGGFNVNIENSQELFPSDLDFFHRHLDLNGRLARIKEPLIIYKYGRDSLSWKISRKTLLRIKAKAFERRIIFNEWSSHEQFMIWGNGRDGRDFLKALSYEGRAKLKGFGDIDPKKIARGYQYERGGIKYPVVYFEKLVPPVVICVAMDRGGLLEKNVASMNWVEGVDYYHIC